MVILDLGNSLTKQSQLKVHLLVFQLHHTLDGVYLVAIKMDLLTGELSSYMITSTTVQ